MTPAQMHELADELHAVAYANELYTEYMALDWELRDAGYYMHDLLEERAEGLELSDTVLTRVRELIQTMPEE